MITKHAYLGGRITVAEAKAETRNGVEVGIVQGYLASWMEEEGQYPDRIERGSFLASIEEHRSRNMRPVRLNYMHVRAPIGGFPIATVKEDGRGLFGVAEINLSTQVGQEAYALARQGVLTDFSVGMSSLERRFEERDGKEIRVITKARLWEASLVDEPMNPDAQVTAVKAAAPYANLPTAPDGTDWDPQGALDRILDLSLRVADPSSAFLDVGRKYQIGDYVDGRIVVVPGAVEAVAAQLRADGVEDRALLSHLDRYCGRLGLASPWPDEADKKQYGMDLVREWSERDLEAALAETGRFTRPAAKFLASKIRAAEGSDPAPTGDTLPPEVWSDVLARINGVADVLKTALR